jgi:hypothetical protein
MIALALALSLVTAGATLLRKSQPTSDVDTVTADTTAYTADHY